MSSKSNTTTTTESNSVKELKSLIAEAEKALASAGDQASEEVDHLGHRFREVLAEGRHAADRVLKAARDQAHHADEFVHEKPYIAIGIAAGLGLVAGVLASRRCH